PIYSWLVLHVCGLLEFLVVVDAEDSRRTADIRAQSADLRIEKAGCGAAGSEKRREAMKIRHAHTNGRPIDLGIFPRNRVRDRSVEEHAEIIGVMRVFPHIVGVDNQMFPNCLFEPGVEIVALTRRNRSWSARNRREDAERVPRTCDN